MKRIKDEELLFFQAWIGKEQYKYILNRECNRSNRYLKFDIRNSKKKYVNSDEKLKAIKEKYKNGVTKEILEEWFK